MKNILAVLVAIVFLGPLAGCKEEARNSAAKAVEAGDADRARAGGAVASEEAVASEAGGAGVPVIIGGFSSPESVVATPDGSRFFVSNVGAELKPSAKDNDGFISELSPEGKVVNMRFLPGDGEVLNAPKGLVILDNTIYTTDIDRVVGFDLTTREKVFELDLSSEGTVFLNDPVVVGYATLLVSATDTGKVYEVTLGERPAFSLLFELPGVNGLYFDLHSSLLFVVSFGTAPEHKGSLGFVSFRTGKAKYTELVGKVGPLDGVAMVPGLGVVFSDWGDFKAGRLMAYYPATDTLTEVELSGGGPLKGPADFFYDETTGKLWLPRMQEGKVHIEKIGG